MIFVNLIESGFKKIILHHLLQRKRSIQLSICARSDIQNYLHITRYAWESKISYQTYKS